MSLLSATLPLLAETSQFQFRGWFPPWLAWTLGILAVIAVVVLYVKEAGRLPLWRRLSLAAIRAAIVVIVAVLLLRPVIVRELDEMRSRPIGILIDVSQSMDQQDPRPNTADQARVAIAMGLADASGGLPDADAVSAFGTRLPDRPKRIAVAADALTNKQISLFPRLMNVGPLEVFTFGTRRTGRNPLPETWIKDVKADEPRTALVEAAFEMINRDDLEAPAALVLVTDGRENAGPRSLAELAQKCRERKIPIHVYGVGSSSFGQLRTAFGSAPADAGKGARVASDIEAPNTLFVDDTAAIPVRYTIKDLSEGAATLVLKYGDREVASKKESFTLSKEEMRKGKTFASILRFVPSRDDSESKKQEYSVQVTVTSGTGATADVITNTISRPAQVVNRKLKVLVVDSLPRRDFQFLQRALLRDRRVDAKFFLTEGDKQAMRSGPPWMVDFSREVNGVLNMEQKEFRQLLFDFDLLILGDVPDRFFTREQQEVIKEFVTEGAGLIQIAGRWHAPAGWATDRKLAGGKNDTNPIADILPVEFDAVKFPIEALESPEGFVPVLAPDASRTQIVSLVDDPATNAELWGKPGPPPAIPDERELKPLYWFYPVTRVKPAADVFLT
ncbi:MAG TPA: vWA domain-containing protein, partial [Gemmata sp.]|nr:vWA domain-containing protein [Gemmata sp.]